MQEHRRQPGPAREGVVRGATPRDETILRLGGFGDCWHSSWGLDDRQLVAFCDGSGFDEPPQRYFNSRMHTIAGGPADARFEDLAGFPDLVDERYPDFVDRPRYYGFGVLAVGERVYHYLSTLDRHLNPIDESSSNARFVGAKLIYSPDGGRTWRNQDGSTPVVWESWDARGKDTMAFFEESQDAFSMLSILQMGRGYAANEDGFVYVYAPNGNTDGTMNELVMFRVPKDEVLDRGAYEYFAGLRDDGGARWTGDIDARDVVHTFPSGWVNTGLNPWAWSPSVVYNAPLGLYMMANWGTGAAADGMWFGKPSYLGLWVSSTPWGPWTQVHEDLAWTPGGDGAARAYKPQIAPKWIAADGRSFWLVWSDFQTAPERQPLLDDFEAATSAEEFLRGRGLSPQAFMAELSRARPRYTFNTQRVDLDVA